MDEGSALLDFVQMGGWKTMQVTKADFCEGCGARRVEGAAACDKCGNIYDSPHASNEWSGQDEEEAVCTRCGKMAKKYKFDKYCYICRGHWIRVVLQRARIVNLPEYREVLSELSTYNPIFTRWEQVDDGLLGRAYCGFVVQEKGARLAELSNAGTSEHGINEVLGNMLVSDGWEDRPAEQLPPVPQVSPPSKRIPPKGLVFLITLTFLSFFGAPPFGTLFMLCVWICVWRWYLKRR